MKETSEDTKLPIIIDENNNEDYKIVAYVPNDGSNIMYEFKDKTSKGRSWSSYYCDNDTFVNDQLVQKVEINRTYGTQYYVPGEISSAYRVSKRRVNVRYELKNKALYNVKVPLIIDDNSKEEYLPLIEDNLYKKVYDEVEVHTNFDIEYKYFDNSFPFEYSLNKLTFEREKDRQGYYQTLSPLVINNVIFSDYDMVMVPMPVLIATRPIAINPRILDTIFADMIYTYHDPKKLKISSNWRSREFRLPNSKEVITTFNKVDDEWKSGIFNQLYYFENYSVALSRINILVDDVLCALYKGDSKTTDRIIADFKEIHSARNW